MNQIELTYNSFFSGIGGFDLALDNTGMTCRAQVEKDPKCRNVLAEHWPSANIRRHNDIKDVGRHNLPGANLACGGFPCQGLSNAGKRAGLDDPRSSLFFEFARVIGETRPDWFIIENVPGLFSTNKGEDFVIVLETLTQLGYGVAWRVLDSQYFGVAQRRRRVFIVGHLGDGRAAEVLFERESLRGDSAPRREAGTRVADPITKSFAKHSGCSAGKDSYPRNIIYPRNIVMGTAPAIRGVAQGNERPGRDAGGVGAIAGDGVVGALAAHSARHGHAMTTQQAAESGQLVPVAFAQNMKGEVRLIGGDGAISGALGAQPGMKQQTYVAFQSKASASQSMNPAEISPALDAGKAGGKAVAWESRYIRNGRGAPTTDGLVNCLQADGQGDSFPMIGVRRLLPTECEVLQGFPRNWTAGNPIPQSDSARYRQLGNAVTVPVIEWIARRLIKVEEQIRKSR